MVLHGHAGHLVVAVGGDGDGHSITLFCIALGEADAAVGILGNHALYLIGGGAGAAAAVSAAAVAAAVAAAGISGGNSVLKCRNLAAVQAVDHGDGFERGGGADGNGTDIFRTGSCGLGTVQRVVDLRSRGRAGQLHGQRAGISSGSHICSRFACLAGQLNGIGLLDYRAVLIAGLDGDELQRRIGGEGNRAGVEGAVFIWLGAIDGVENACAIAGGKSYGLDGFVHAGIDTCRRCRQCAYRFALTHLGICVVSRHGHARVAEGVFTHLDGVGLAVMEAANIVFGRGKGGPTGKLLGGNGISLIDAILVTGILHRLREAHRTGDDLHIRIVHGNGTGGSVRLHIHGELHFQLVAHNRRSIDFGNGGGQQADVDFGMGGIDRHRLGFGVLITLLVEADLPGAGGNIPTVAAVTAGGLGIFLSCPFVSPGNRLAGNIHFKDGGCDAFHAVVFHGLKHIAGGIDHDLVLGDSEFPAESEILQLQLRKDAALDGGINGFDLIRRPTVDGTEGDAAKQRGALGQRRCIADKADAREHAGADAVRVIAVIGQLDIVLHVPIQALACGRSPPPAGSSSAVRPGPLWTDRK